MIDLGSALAGAVVAGTSSSVLYAAYLRGRRDAKEPDNIVDLDEVGNYLKQRSALEALEQDIDQSG